MPTDRYGFPMSSRRAIAVISVQVTLILLTSALWPDEVTGCLQSELGPCAVHLLGGKSGGTVVLHPYAILMTRTDQRQLHRRQQLEAAYDSEKQRSQQKLVVLTRQRLEQLQPDLYLPQPWVPVHLNAPLQCFKVVAAAAGKFVSVFDGTTQYRPNKWSCARAGYAHDSSPDWPALWSCLHVYLDSTAAKGARFPPSSKHLDGAHVLIRATAVGKAYFHPEQQRFAVARLRVDAVEEYLPPRGRPSFLPASLLL